MKKILFLLILATSNICMSQSEKDMQQILELKESKPNVFFSIMKYAKQRCESVENKKCINESISISLYAYNSINAEYNSEECNELALAISIRKNSYKFKFSDGAEVVLVNYVLAYGDYLEEYKHLTKEELYRRFPEFLVKD